MEAARKGVARLLIFFLGLACGMQVLVCVGEFLEPLSRIQHALHLAALCLVSLSTPLALTGEWRLHSGLAVKALLAGAYLLLLVCRHLRRLAQAGSAGLDPAVAALSLCTAPALLTAWGLLIFFG